VLAGADRLGARHRVPRPAGFAELQEAAQRGPGQPESDQAIVVFARRGGLTAADVDVVSSARRAVGQLAGRVGGLGPPGPLQRSADGQAGVFTATVTAPQHSLTSTDTNAVKAIRRAVQDLASRAHDGLQVAVTGQAAVTADSGSGTQTALLLQDHSPARLTGPPPTGRSPYGRVSRLDGPSGVCARSDADWPNLTRSVNAVVPGLGSGP
jgi:hypothetical protein